MEEPCASHGRNRCSLGDSAPQFRRSKSGTEVVCNRCNAPLKVTDDESLRTAVHGSTWALYGWKTFLCPTCAVTAATVSTYAPQGSYCLACYNSPSPPSNVMLTISTRRGGVLALCVRCAHADENQLKTLSTREQIRAAVSAAVAHLSA